ncbi:glucosylglycerol 3-phosphatase [Synechococcales cyanobacterium C]|uniref:Glucosylglycerol 3-phosphatase n=1 Tax=Petrachloros mirabilis ULC683 TaxID=2781853 RepID=A0A8K1ZZR3_9CYAN|nr:glucosylglycerol 3-phosphatase [Petrachloros mirabilis]NCJ08159.1 glucosylglycerol 3-phosphatase [Petrachloros mirabilis ULC683]
MNTTAPLHEQFLSLDHNALAHLLATQENLLIIQDLDGVCMGLVKDPLTRQLDKRYIEATQTFAAHFFVLTNGEHIGERGVNRILEAALDQDGQQIQQEGLYLPGLAGGGVQWQDRFGCVSHPGVSEAELAFLAAVPTQIGHRLRAFFEQQPWTGSAAALEKAITAAVLDNQVSPTANLNVFYEQLQDQPAVYRDLQQAMQTLMEDLLAEAQSLGLGESFFVHYAPNLGKDVHGQERLQLASETASGTTDFQFMLRGAVKEVGVLALLNRYYFERTGTYPLGENFNVRQAPRSHPELLALAQAHFDPAHMPTIIGVGDTVTSQVEEENGTLEVRRGGSDRGFLHLVQDLGRTFETGNVVVYIDSSAGEVKNRRPLKLQPLEGTNPPGFEVVAGPGDPRDRSDPLLLNVGFPGGHQQYIELFCQAAHHRAHHSIFTAGSSLPKP